MSKQVWLANTTYQDKHILLIESNGNTNAVVYNSLTELLNNVKTIKEAWIKQGYQILYK